MHCDSSILLSCGTLLLLVSKWGQIWVALAVLAWQMIPVLHFFLSLFICFYHFRFILICISHNCSFGNVGRGCCSKIVYNIRQSDKVFMSTYLCLVVGHIWLWGFIRTYLYFNTWSGWRCHSFWVCWLLLGAKAWLVWRWWCIVLLNLCVIYLESAVCQVDTSTFPQLGSMYYVSIHVDGLSLLNTWSGLMATGSVRLLHWIWVTA